MLCLGLYASIALIFVAGDVLLFLIAWEIMSILSYLLVVFEHEREGRADAGYLLLALGEAGALAGLFGLLLLAARAGSLDFAALKMAAFHLGPGARWAIFLLTFFGFGVKAGLVPVNFWLPRAYVAAPSRIRASACWRDVESGPLWDSACECRPHPDDYGRAGFVALVIGTISALLGILYATTENDLKLMLAHSSIENVGIVVAGLGAGLVFRASSSSGAGSDRVRRGALSSDQSFTLQDASVFRRGRGGNPGGHARYGSAGRADQMDAVDGLGFLAGVARDCGAAAVQRLCQRMAHPADHAALGRIFLDRGENRFRACGAGLALTAALAVTCFVKVFAMGFFGMSRAGRTRKAGLAKRGARARLRCRFWPGSVWRSVCCRPT